MQEQEVAVVAQALDELQHAVEAVTARTTDDDVHATDATTTTASTAAAAATAVVPSTALLTAAAFVDDGMSAHHYIKHDMHCNGRLDLMYDHIPHCVLLSCMCSCGCSRA
jgi:hypothetical protein